MMWPSILVVVFLHMVSFVVNLDAAIMGTKPSSVGIVVSAALILAWVAIGVLMGFFRKPKFVVWALGFWLGSVLVVVCGFALDTGNWISALIMGAAILVLVPCYPLAAILPVEDAQAAIITMVLTCGITLAAYAIAAGLRRINSNSCQGARPRLDPTSAAGGPA